MIQRAISVIEDADAIPELGVFLGAGEVIEGALVGLVGGLELILHQVAVAERAPEIAVGIVDLEGATEVIDGLAKERGISV